MSEAIFDLEWTKNDFIVIMTAAVPEFLSESTFIKQTTELFSFLFNNLQSNFGQQRFSAKMYKQKIKGKEFAYLLVTSV